MDRRSFLHSTALGTLALTWARPLRADEPTPLSPVPARRKVLVVVFQRGAVDGLHVVVPYADPHYAQARPRTALATPSLVPGLAPNPDAVLDLDGHFGLHPALAPLLPLYRAGKLGFVHAVGSPDRTRSHFDAQDFMELGTPGQKTTVDGFLARALAQRPQGTALRALAVTPLLPRALSGDLGALVVPDLQRFSGKPGRAGAQATFEHMYAQSPDKTLESRAHESFEALRVLQQLPPVDPLVAGLYPQAPLGRSLAQIAHVIKADVGLEVAFTEVGGWDTHVGQGAAQGQLANQLRPWGQALAAFAQDLGPKLADVVVLSVSEFGRTVQENGSGGTDHGHGTVFTLLGGPVRGGKVHGTWPGLAPDQRFEGRDLAITTDFRDVCAEILARHLDVRDMAKVFPGRTFGPKSWPGVLS
jgi:uncharacterized protein (DUF1501 family)